MARYKVEVVRIISLIVEADSEEAAKERALSAPIAEGELEDEQIDNVCECDENGDPIDD